MSTIYSEVQGSGPPFLLIPGGNGDAAPFGAVRRFLVDRYTVITYDRRGYSRSRLDAPPDDDSRLAADIEDALALLEPFEAPATVFGSSSGAIVGLHLLVEHPERVGRLLAHEPPLASLLPDAETWLAACDAVYATYLDAGVEAAMKQFGEVTGLGAPEPRVPQTLPPHVREMMERMERNYPFFLEHELRQYVRLTPDLDALAKQSDRLILASGQESGGQLPYLTTQALAKRLDVPIAQFPGSHVGYVTHSDAFAATLAHHLG